MCGGSGQEEPPDEEKGKATRSPESPSHTRSEAVLIKPAEGMSYSLFHEKKYAFTRKVLKKTPFFFFGTTVRIKHYGALT